MVFSRPVRDSASVLALGLVATSSLVAAGPCDIYQAGNTPCVAAHSTTRALYDQFNGALYQVQRASDKKTTTIKPLAAGGVANAATQDTFCKGTTCVITIIYDQSGKGNDLSRAPAGGAAPGPDNLAAADGAPVTVNGHKAYGVFSPPGTGYRNDKTSGIATGDEAEGIYGVFDGTHYDAACCYDYGNAEVNNLDNGATHMETVYFGAWTAQGTGSGPGPWVMMDMENGVWSGYVRWHNEADPTRNSRFVTGMVKGKANHWAIRAGDSTQGKLVTGYDGKRPAGYEKMNKEGAIILGIGGDNSDGSAGTFYEGVMTSGYPTNATEDKVQANIVAAKYSAAAMTSGKDLPMNSSVSIQSSTASNSSQYLSHNGSSVNTHHVSENSTAAEKQQASWIVRSGLGNANCSSFESVDTPGSFLQHKNFTLQVNANDHSKQFGEDATFCPQAGMNGTDNTHSLRSWNHPGRYVRLFDNNVHAASNGGAQAFDTADSFSNDVTWAINGGFA